MVNDITVLFVDDEDDMLEIFAGASKSLVSCTLTANRPSLAVELAKKQNVDLAILDFRMPEMTGLDLLKELRKINPHLECIFFTGYGDQEMLQRALKMHAIDFLDKPCDVEAFLKSLGIAIQKILDRRARMGATADTKTAQS